MHSNGVTLPDPQTSWISHSKHAGHVSNLVIDPKWFFCGDFLHTHQVLIDNAITGSKEGEDMWNEVFFLRLQGLPVLEVFGKVHLNHCRINKKQVLLWEPLPEPRGRPRLRAPTPHLLRRPEGGLGLLVHLPDVVVLDGEDDEAAGVLPQQRLLLLPAPRHLEWRERLGGARGGARGEAEGTARGRPPRGKRAGRAERPLRGRGAGQGGETPLRGRAREVGAPSEGEGPRRVRGRGGRGAAGPGGD